MDYIDLGTTTGLEGSVLIPDTTLLTEGKNLGLTRKIGGASGRRSFKHQCESNNETLVTV